MNIRPIDVTLRDPLVETLTARAEYMVVEIAELRAEVARLRQQNRILRRERERRP